ncbi:MAG: tyrosine-type recombinase/integrase [bacterium]
MYKNPKLVNEYLRKKESEDLSENTIKTYSHSLHMFFKYVSEHKFWESIEDISLENMEDITLDDCKEFLSTCNSTGDKNKKIGAIRRFYDYLQEEGYIQENIMKKIKMNNRRKRLPVYLKENEAKRLTKASRTGKHKERNYCIMVFLLNIGLRLFELQNLKLCDIEGRYLRIIGKGDKERRVYINSTSKEALNEYLKVRPDCNTEAIFISNRNKKISRQSIQVIVKNSLKKARLDTKKYSVHSLRSTCGTLMREKGAEISDIQEQFGHSDVRTTLNYYAHTTDQKRKHVANLIDIG